MNWVQDLFTNIILMTSICSWLTAQVLKTIIYAAINKKIDFKRLVGDGGMPSGHSATVTSLAVMCGLIHGVDSSQFAISAIFAIVVCHDAMGVRLETGKQAVIINEMLAVFDALTSKQLPEVKLKEFVGHTPLQVIAGILLGIANALVIYFFIV
ncbi:MAG: divergent PAP2 family protein [Lachnospiraceae bacterium]|nr:divergent PAP2 family protein [Lachnospiraceae bacterium]